jgi:tRNA(Ile)-lysidine synthase
VHRRNALRLDVVPAFAATFPGYPATLARAASHQAEAARLADDLAEIDSLSLRVGDGLDRNAFAGLPAHRARNVLRRFLHAHGLRAPSAARLEAMQVQLCTARGDARVELRHDGAAIGVHRGLVVVHAPAPRPFARSWLGEADLALPHGRLSFVPGEGEGIARSRLDGRDVVVRAREGGERLKLAADRPRRALKAWLQEAGVPAWERAALPLVFCDGELAAVAGLGVDVAFAAPHGAASLRLVWRPDR